MKIATFIGTRPEIIRLSRIIPLLDRNADQIIVHTGQNYDYELNQIFFEDLEIRKPDVFLEAARPTAAETIGTVIAESEKVLREIRPDAFLVLGDTNSCLAAIAAKRLKIPIFHMEAGNRCFDERVPEEINRKIVDHIADINLPYSSISRAFLLREGIPADRVITTGSPMLEVLNYYRPKIEASNILGRLGLDDRGYFVVSSHREEIVDDPLLFRRLLDVLRNLVEAFGQRVIVSTHPRTRRRIEQESQSLPAGVEFLKPFGFSDYVKLQKHATVVLSDSGTITEESNILGFPALNIREVHERPEGMEETAVMMTGTSWGRIRESIAILDSFRREAGRSIRLAADYGVPNVSEKILRIIVSYTDYVNRFVWRKTIDS